MITIPALKARPQKIHDLALMDKNPENFKFLSYPRFNYQIVCGRIGFSLSKGSCADGSDNCIIMDVKSLVMFLSEFLNVTMDRDGIG